MKREMSVEMRLGEMEDYKGHIKQDLVSRGILSTDSEFITQFPYSNQMSMTFYHAHR